MLTHTHTHTHTHTDGKGNASRRSKALPTGYTTMTATEAIFDG